MLEVQPVSPSFPVVKPKKIDRDDHRPEQQQCRKKPEAEEQDAELIQHIDEIA
ncbi:MAG TPA: hypothetical protein VIF86_04970 [Methylobacter sp.]|jgi:hypothetical protein